MSQAASKLRRPQFLAWLKLSVVVLAAAVGLGVVVLQARGVEPPPFRSRFSRAELRKLQRDKPNVVLIGNSMVLTRFHVPTLQRLLAPRKALLLAYPGAASAVWYLLLKNYVARSKHKPNRVLVFFRTYELTEPRLRSTGKYQSRIASLMPAPDPNLELKLRPGMERWSSRLAYGLGTLAPLERLRPQVQRPISQAAHGVTSFFAEGLDEEAQSREVNSVFDLAHLRSTADQPGTVFNSDFSSAVETSFLPDMLEIGKEHGLPLTFVRVRQLDVARGKAEEPELQPYLTQLEAYLRQHGAGYWDMKSATWETEDMYLDESGHLKKQVMPRYTQLFVEQLPQLLD